jgi:TRAP-type C4-dicarboxylate transport system substrate-binding protein
MTDPIIEAAARLIAYSWDEATENEREYSREAARAVLTAVTPLIEAAALERAAQRIEADEEDYVMRNEVAAAIRAIIPAKDQS